MITSAEMDLFWGKISSQIYLVMRNFESVVNDINNGGDLDILVANKEQFIELVGAMPMRKETPCYNYSVKIGRNIIPVDLREVGDEYYDAKWEREMLENRESMDLFYIMKDSDYKFSILYHVLFHKKEIPSKYALFLNEEFGTVDDRSLELILYDYMRRQGYHIGRPMDKGVYFNRRRYYIFKMSIIIYGLKRFKRNTIVT